ncbi:hypothetical protein ACHZ97_14160 [Lysobacter soli]|uniref:hypothetical protein n=1 Tax=Lysobacter soli TaxID=453783 RepID=UPI0037C52228
MARWRDRAHGDDVSEERREQHARIASALHDAEHPVGARQRLCLSAPPVSSLHTIRLSSLCNAPQCLLSRAPNHEIPRNDCTPHESLDEITQRKSQSET